MLLTQLPAKAMTVLLTSRLMLLRQRSTNLPRRPLSVALMTAKVNGVITTTVNIQTQTQNSPKNRPTLMGPLFLSKVLP